MTCTYQYVVTDTNPPVTYLEDGQGEGYRYPVSFTDPAKQAPWLPALTPDPSIPLKAGEKERGYFQLNVPPADFLMPKKHNERTRYVDIHGDTVLERWDGLFPESDTAQDYNNGLYFPFKGTAFFSEEARLWSPDELKGVFHFGVCEVLGYKLTGNITLDGGVHVNESYLHGNIEIKAPIMLYICHLLGNIAIDFGVQAKTYKEYDAPDFEAFMLEDITLTLKKSEMWCYFLENHTMNGGFDVWEATHTLTSKDVRRFCLDTANHIDNCKCGLFLPFYLGLHPVAIQYFGLVDKRKPALLPEPHPVASVSLANLEDILFNLIAKWDKKWFYEYGYDDCALAWKEMSGEEYPDSYDEWRARMVEITGVDPETYLPE